MATQFKVRLADPATDLASIPPLPAEGELRGVQPEAREMLAAEAVEPAREAPAEVRVEQPRVTPVAVPRPRSTRTRGFLSAGLTARLNLLCDLVVLVGVLLFGHQVIGISGNPSGLAPVLPLALFAGCVWALTAIAVRHYKGSAYQAVVVDDAAMTAVILIAVFTALFVANKTFRAIGGPHTDLRILLLDLVIALSVRPLFRYLSRREIPSEEVLVVGGGVRGRLVAESIERSNNERVLGMVPLEGERSDERSPSLLGQFADLERILRSLPVSKVYVAGNVLKDAVCMQQTITLCERLGIPFALPAYSFRLGRALPADAQGLHHGYVHYTIYEAKIRRHAVKRVFDIVASGTALWLLLPLLAVVAVLIKLTSRGPFLFKQERVGLHGRRFNMLKFRSMVVDAEALKARLASLNEQSGPVFKMRNDPRVTRIGRFIRKYSIDELPQLINVLRGDMSVVGPRPPVPKEVADYEAWQMRRLSVRPGLTCLWQVSGRSQISFDEWMYLDMQYIDHWSLAQDLRLIFRTVPVVFTGRGSS